MRSNRVERIVWLVLLLIGVFVAGFAGYDIAKKKYRREAVGNLNQVPMLVSKYLFVLRERPDELPGLLETSLDLYSGFVWDLGVGMPEVTNTLRTVKRYRTIHPDYSPEPGSEDGRRFQKTQEILAQINEKK